MAWWILNMQTLCLWSEGRAGLEFLQCTQAPYYRCRSFNLEGHQTSSNEEDAISGWASSLIEESGQMVSLTVLSLAMSSFQAQMAQT